MIKFLTLLLSLLDRFFKGREEGRLRQEGKDQAVKEAEDEVQRQVDLAEHVAVAIDPDYDKRLRSRFDAAARSE